MSVVLKEHTEAGKGFSCSLRVPVNPIYRFLIIGSISVSVCMCVNSSVGREQMLFMDGAQSVG
jgi:hypothetical protein